MLYHSDVLALPVSVADSTNATRREKARRTRKRIVAVAVAGERRTRRRIWEHLRTRLTMAFRAPLVIIPVNATSSHAHINQRSARLYQGTGNIDAAVMNSHNSLGCLISARNRL